MPARRPVAATPMAYARAVVAAYEARGLDPAGALRAAQIAPSGLRASDARITARQLELLSGWAMQELDDEGLGAFSRPLPWGTYGMLARASLSAPTLGIALARWCRHHGLVAPGVRLALTTTADTAAIALHEDQPMAAAQREFCTAFVLRNVHGLACWFIDSRIPLSAARFPFPAPAHAAAYVHMFPAALAFGAAHAEIRFDARYLALPLRRDEKAMRQMLQRALPIPVLQYRRDRLIVEQARAALAADPEAARNAAALAALLNISARTLHRQLSEAGASLQQLKDEVRRERAQDLLLRSGKPLKQVAQAAGFASEKSFSRAFRQWTGVSPGGFRERREP